MIELGDLRKTIIYMCWNVDDISPSHFFTFNIDVILIVTFLDESIPDIRNVDRSNSLLLLQAILSPDADPPVLRLFGSNDYKYELHDDGLVHLCIPLVSFSRHFLQLPS